MPAPSNPKESTVVKVMIVAGATLAMVTAACAADLPRPQPVPPQPAIGIGKMPVGKAPIGKAPVGKGPVGKGPVPGPVVSRY